jgi:hypothetical protein
MQNRNQRISDIAQQIQDLTNELSELLLLSEQESASTIADQAPPDTAHLRTIPENPPLGLGDTVELIGGRDRLRGETGEIVKVTAQQFAIRLTRYPNNPRPTYRYKDKVKRVRIVDTVSQ